MFCFASALKDAWMLKIPLWHRKSNIYFGVYAVHI